MIADKLENYHLYNSLSKHIKTAFDYVLNTNLKQTPVGKYAIDGDTIFAVVMEYTTKNYTESKCESHYEYIDLQYIITGTEYVGVATLSNEDPISKDIQKDLYFYNSPSSSLLKFNQGTFMIFFPDDLHMPSVHINSPEFIKKVVVKIKK